MDRIVAIINESIITLSELNAATAMTIEKLGEKAEPRKIEEMRGRVLESLVEQKLVKQASDKAGIEVSEREIDNAVEDVKRQNEMTQERLLLALAGSGLTYKEYREQLKEQIRQVKFINKEIRSKVSVIDEDVEDYYKRNMKEFYGPASYRLSLIFIPAGASSKAKLKAVEEGISSGTPFSSLAREYSEGPGASNGGDLGWMTSGEMSGLLKDAASRLAPGESSPPIDAPEGVYFVRLVEKKDSSPMPFQEVRGQIQDKLYKKIMDERFNFWLSQEKKTAHLEVRF